MRLLQAFPFALILPFVAACTAVAGVDGLHTQGAGGATTSSTTTGSGMSFDTCDQVDNGFGCCDASGVLHYCAINDNTPSTQACAAGTACGWSATEGYYDCVTGNAGPDPSGTYPMACGSSASTTSSTGSSMGNTTSSTTTTTSTGTSGGVTWTQIYTTIFGPSGSSSCVAGGGCHTFNQSGFKCGTSKSTCYTGIVNSGLVVPGSSASSSPLVDPQQSPLCGSLGGSMPKGGKCVSASNINDIKSWLAAGAQND